MVFYRTGSTGALQLLKDNAGKASLTIGNPIILTPAQIEKPADTGDDVGALEDFSLPDVTSQKVFQLNLTFDVGEVSSLRGKEFVIAGVTRAPFVESSASARPRVNLNLFEEDPALEEWRVGELAVAKIPALS